jgi:predicted enzyme related to lactoylglutathione lyase
MPGPCFAITENNPRWLLASAFVYCIHLEPKRETAQCNGPLSAPDRTHSFAAIGSAFCWSWALSPHLGATRKVAYVANFWSGVTIDCVDPERVARFWSALLGREPGPSQAGWVYLGHRGDAWPRLIFQPVPEPKAGKVRIHLDLTVDDVDEAIELVTSLGGQATGERHDYDEGVVVVMADPEGHEFCLAQYY